MEARERIPWSGVDNGFGRGEGCGPQGPFLSSFHRFPKVINADSEPLTSQGCWHGFSLKLVF